MSKSLPLSVRLTKENLFEALKKHRCYASEDENIRVKFTEKMLLDLLFGRLKEVLE